MTHDIKIMSDEELRNKSKEELIKNFMELLTYARRSDVIYLSRLPHQK